MDSVDDLKNDIVKSNAVVKHEQEVLKDKIEKGAWDDMDTFFDDPELGSLVMRAKVFFVTELVAINPFSFRSCS